MKNFFKRKAAPGATPSQTGTTTQNDESYKAQYSPDIEREIGELDHLQESMAQDGRGEGAQGIPAHDITEFHVTEKTLQAKHQRVIDKAASILGQEKASMERGNEQTREEIDTFDHSKTEEYYRNETADEEALENDAAVSDAMGKEERLKEDKRRAEKELAQREADNENKIDKGGGKVPTKKWWRDTLYFYGILAFFVVCEVSFNIVALMIIGESSNILAIIGALGFSVLIVVLGHYLAHAVKDKSLHKIVISIVGSIIFLILVTALRMKGEQLALLSFINVLIYMATYFLSADRIKYQEFFLNNDQIQVPVQKIGSQKQEIRTVNTMLKQEKQAIAKKYRERAKAEVTQKWENLKEELNKGEIRLANLLAYGKGVEQQVTAKFNISLNIFRTKNTEQRQGKFPPVELWKREKSPSLRRSFSEGINPMPTPSKAKVPSQNGSVMAMVALVFVGLFGLTSCGVETVAPTKSTDVVVLIDLTDTITEGASTIPDYIAETVLGIEENTIATNGADVTVSTIQETSIQRVEKAHLPLGGGFLLRNDRKRKEETAHFINEIKRMIGDVLSGNQERKQSEIMASFCQHLPKLAASTAEKKIVLLFSDGLQHNSDISFYEYRDKEKTLRTDYENIVSVFESECDLGDLNGIGIRIVHLPNEQTDRLFLESFNFWKRYLTAKGATVIHLPNL